MKESTQAPLKQSLGHSRLSPIIVVRLHYGGLFSCEHILILGGTVRVVVAGTTPFRAPSAGCALLHSFRINAPAIIDKECGLCIDPAIKT
jgi:hypothetical protein